MNIRKFASSVVLAGALALSSAANAAVLTLDFAGFKSGSRSGTISVTEGGETTTITGARAGMFVFNVLNVEGEPGLDIFDQIVAFCIEANVMLERPADYQLLPAPDYFSPAQLAAVEQLFSQFLSQTGTRDTDAAFQLALWELVYDGDGDLSSGNFVASGFGDALGIAQNWLNNLGVGGKFSNLWALRAPGDGVENVSQDLITWGVPEPGSLALLGAGLIAFGAFRRRRTA